MKRNPGASTHGDLFTVHDPDRWSGWHQLVCGILRRAANDAKSANGFSQGAREWLRNSPWAVFYLASIGLDRTAAARFLETLETC